LCIQTTLKLVKNIFLDIGRHAPRAPGYARGAVLCHNQLLGRGHSGPLTARHQTL